MRAKAMWLAVLAGKGSGEGNLGQQWAAQGMGSRETPCPPSALHLSSHLAASTLHVFVTTACPAQSPGLAGNSSITAIARAGGGEASRTGLLRLKPTLQSPWLLTNEDSQVLPELQTVGQGFSTWALVTFGTGSFWFFQWCPVHCRIFSSSCQ